MKKILCCDCNKALIKDEIALSRKLIDEDTEEYYCLPSMHSRVRFRLRVPQIIIQKTIELQGKIAARCTKKRRKTRRSWLP